MMDDFSHLQSISYNIQVGENVTPMIALFNCNKLPTGVAVKCIEQAADNRYLLCMTADKFNAIFLDDGEAFRFNPEEPVEPSEDAKKE